MNDAKQPQPCIFDEMNQFLKKQIEISKDSNRTQVLEEVLVAMERREYLGKCWLDKMITPRKSATRSLAGEAAQPQAWEDLCPRCAIGRDNNGDGDCIICAKKTDKEVIESLRLRLLSTCTPPVASAFAIFFDDADMETEMFAGEGAEFAARQRYSAAKLNWNCHLFARIESSPAALSPAQAATPNWDCKFCDYNNNNSDSRCGDCGQQRTEPSAQSVAGNLKSLEQKALELLLAIQKLKEQEDVKKT